MYFLVMMDGQERVCGYKFHRNTCGWLKTGEQPLQDILK